MMRRKTEHKKRYKDYPKNVPRKLLKLFFDLDCKMLSLAKARGVNVGIISFLLNDGKEPKDSSIRSKLYLPAHPICKCCGKKIINRKKVPAAIAEPEYIKKWRKLSKQERQRAIEAYIKWK
jgi:hypothetical protein